MILTDAGPLVALIDTNEQAHERCAEAAAELSMPLLTTWPAVTEAMYLLRSKVGWRGQEALWKIIVRGDVEMAPIDDEVRDRARALMAKFRDAPMDFADATLVAVAEQRGLRQIFTLDSQFRIYRLHGRNAFEVVP